MVLKVSSSNVKKLPFGAISGLRKQHGYWENRENILQFLSGLKQKYNLNTPDDWNSITTNHIKTNGGSRLLKIYSIFELKCMICPEGKSKFNNPPRPSGYWENKENVLQFLLNLKEKYNLNTPDDWSSISTIQVKSSGGNSLLHKYSIFELKCMACPEGKSIFNNPPQESGYWENKENVLRFLSNLKEKYNLNTTNDWNSITHKQIQDNGGGTLLHKYSMYELKCMAHPEGKSTFNNPNQPPGYWENRENFNKFLSELQIKYNLTTPDDWNSITTNHIKSNGGSRLLNKYSMYELKCMACPEGKLIFNNSPQPPGYWENKENIFRFLSKLKEKYNLNTPSDWNLITKKQIQDNGGSTLCNKYSMYELKCMACPDEHSNSIFDNKQQIKPAGYWENKEKILQFLAKLKEKYSLNTPGDWNSISTNHIKSNGGSSLLKKYSMYELKCMACPEGKLLFNHPKQPKPSGYWKNKENINKFLSELQIKYNLNTPDDWNSITQKHIQESGGSRLLNKYSIYELKCLACPEGISKFNDSLQIVKYWENKENVLQFLSNLKEKYSLNTPDDWNSITTSHIKSNGGSKLLNIYSMYELKCMACPEGYSIFNNPKPSGYWKNKENINKFLSKLKEKYNLNTPDDWKRISKRQIISQGGLGLFKCKNINNIEIQFDIQNETQFIPLTKLISFHTHKRASQRWLFLQIQKLFPGDEIVEDYFHSELSRISGANIQFDIFINNKNIAIEYHGQQHYEDLPRAFSNVETYQCRDLEKETLCKKHGIQLIVIPYWWDNKLDSLRASLYSKITL